MKCLVSVSFVASVLICGAKLFDDCQPHWNQDIGQPGMNNVINALAIFDDGSGPALYAAGQFTTAGGVTAHRVARWDGADWSPVGGGMNNIVHALAVFDDGTGPALYAGGRFTTAGGTSANRIAKWNGAAWSPLGSGLGGSEWNDAVYALAVYDNGYGPALYAGGQFTIAGFGTIVNRIAKWIPAAPAWVPVGNGGLSGTVRSLAVFDDGSGPALYAGGEFTTAIELGDGEGGCYGFCGQQTPEGCYCGLGCCFLGDCCENFCEACGDCAVGGQCTNGVNVNRIARWDGSSWSDLDGGVTLNPWSASVNALAVYNGELVVAGRFNTAGVSNAVSAANIARWDGTTWLPLENGMNDAVHALVTFDHGQQGEVLFAGGMFTAAGGKSANHIARWNGQSWSPLNGGVSGAVHGLVMFDPGDGTHLYVGGQFTTAGGETAGRIARWHDCPTPPQCALADLNCDGAVDVSDLLIVLGAWGPCGKPCPADLNGDGVVDVTDLLTLLGSWG